MSKKDDGLYLSINGRTFLLKNARDVTPQEMIELSLPPERAPEYVAGLAPGLTEYAVYERKFVLPPRGKIPRLTHKKLWELGRKYADYAAPHIVERARATGYHLPTRDASELFPVLKDVYALLERDYRIPWDNLLAGQQDDFLTGFWNRLREKGIVERRIEGVNF